MKYFLLVIPFLISFSFAATDAVVEETLYLNFKDEVEQGIPDKTFLGFSNYEQSLAVDALQDSLEEGVNAKNLASLQGIESFHYSIVEKLRLNILRIQYDGAKTLDSDVENELSLVLAKPEVETRLIYVIAAHEKLLLDVGEQNIIALAKNHEEYANVVREGSAGDQRLDEIVTDLYFNTPDVSSYMDGEYVNAVKIFMFCHNNRLYPCLMVMKGIDGKEFRNTDGTLWTHPAMASAVTGLPSYQRNGNTPAGILTIDSVMPVADQQLSYGKNRRMILNFIPKSKDEVLMKSLIPKSSWDHDWWQPTTVARDIGRNMFRIHGSGRINKEPNTPYFPFNRTHGCISQRENTYDGVTYNDQRNLLDGIMKAMGLEPKFANEPKVKGILYLIELDDTNAATTAEELKEFGIE